MVKHENSLAPDVCLAIRRTARWTVMDSRTNVCLSEFRAEMDGFFLLRRWMTGENDAGRSMKTFLS